MDARSGALLCAVHPLDKSANADGQRRRLDAVGPDLSPMTPTAMAPLMRQLLAEHAATGLPPAYLPTPGAGISSPTPPNTPSLTPPENLS